MFTSIQLKNFRNHRNSSIVIGPVTLIIGPNGAGKTNFLRGLEYISSLIRDAVEASSNRSSDIVIDYASYRTQKSAHNAPLVFFCNWSHKGVEISYELMFTPSRKKSGSNSICNEKLTCSHDPRQEFAPKTVELSPDPSTCPSLFYQLNQLGDPKLRNCAKKMFYDLARLHYYHFEPSVLRSNMSFRISRLTGAMKKDIELLTGTSKPGDLKADEIGADPPYLRSKGKARTILTLGKRGEGLGRLLYYLKCESEPKFDDWEFKLRSFVDDFLGVEFKRTGNECRVIWRFDHGGNEPDRLETDSVSDGLLRAAALALLMQLQFPPALILCDEVENGISRSNLQKLLEWIRNAPTCIGSRTQVILTTHSPVVLMQMSDQPQFIFQMRMHPREFVTIVTSVNALLVQLIGSGYVEGDTTDKQGKMLAHLSPQKVIDLWYGGLVGGEVS